MGEDNFHLAARKMPTRTCPESVAKVDIVGPGCCVLVFERISRKLAQFREAETVEDRGAWPECGIEVECVGSYHDSHAAGDGLAAGQLEASWIRYDTGHVCCWELAISHRQAMIKRG